MAEVDQRDDDVPVPRKTPVTGSHSLAGNALPATRLLGAIGAAVFVHVVLGFALLEVVVGARASTLRGALGLIVALTGLAAALTGVLARRKGLDQATRSAPGVFGLLPSLASVTLGLGWLWAVQDRTLDAAVLATVPLLACTTAPGLAVALVLEHTLTAMTARLEERGLRPVAEASEGPAKPGREPPTLADRLTRLVVGLAVATILLILAHATVHTSSAEPWLTTASSYLAMIGASLLVIVAGLAAASAGRSPGRDVEALAHRLDAIGWGDSPERALSEDGPEDAGTSGSRASAVVTPRPLASPVRVTSFDAVGELFANLEHLRERLAADVHTYQRALDRTRAADAAKREFLAAVSHELRTPLNSILGFAQVLLESDLTKDQADDVRLILAGGSQLKDLIEDILDLSMIESGELELRFAPCSLAELVEDIVDIHQAQVHDRGVELGARILGEVPEVVCDRKRIGQVLTNLLSNAIKFTDEGRVGVHLSYAAGRGEVSIAVSDTGVGIATEELEAIFEEYQQVGSTKKKIRGTGLGLAIARRIAEAHGGALSATSELGVGSTFTLRLPLAPPEPEPIGGPR